MEKSDKVETQQLEGETEKAQGDLVELGTMDVKAEFDEMVIWGHESSADAASDPYVRSIEEWLAAAELVGVSVVFKRCAVADLIFRYTRTLRRRLRLAHNRVKDSLNVLLKGSAI